MLKHQKLIEKMTLDEKIALLNSVSEDSTEKQKRFGIPSAVFAGKGCGVCAPADDEGVVAPATCFPEPSAIARSWDLEVGSKVAYCMGKEAAALGVNAICAPDANVVSDPESDKNYARFSEDPYLAGKMTAAYVRAIQKNGVAACLEAPELDEEKTAWVDERALREVYLQPYEMAVKEGGVKALRVSKNRINGESLSSSKHILRGIIRGEWQYEGIVVSEDKPTGNNVEALIGGNDLALGVATLSNISVELSRACKKYELYQKGLADGSIRRSDYEKALDSGTVLEPEVLDAAVDRVIEFIRTTKLNAPDDRDVSYSAYPFRHKVVFGERAHARVAQEAAEASAVLLKNTAGALPIANDTPVAFMGEIIKRPFSQGEPSDKMVATGGESTIMSVGKTQMNVVGCAQGYGSGESEQGRQALLDEACALATGAEVVVIYVGTDENNKPQKTENGYALPADQIALIEAVHGLGKKIVAVLVGSETVDMSWDAMCDAVLLAGSLGQSGTKAVLRLLSGEVSPSGKLTQTIASIPATSKVSEDGADVEFRASVFGGYRYCEKTGVNVRYPFGFGLSYSEFKYSDMTVESDGVSFTLENIGTCGAAEVAQMYIGKSESLVPRAAKELKGFAKVFLNAGESCRVKIPFDSKTFRFYNVKTRRWEIEGGEYSVYVCSDSATVKLESTLSIDGTSAEGIYKKEELNSYFDGDISAAGSAEFAALYNNSVRNGKFYSLAKRKKSPAKLIGFIPVVFAAAVDVILALSIFAPIIFKDLYYVLSDEEKFLGVLGMGLLSAAAAAFCVLFWRGVNKKQRIESGDIALSQWNADLYVPDLKYPEDWKDINVRIDDVEEAITVEEEEDDGIAKDRENAMFVPFDIICKEYCEYAKLRGVVVTPADARQLIAAFSASRMVFIKNADPIAAKTAVTVLGEFLQMRCYSATVGENINTLEELLMPSSTSDLLSAIVDSRTASKAFYMSVLCNVRPENMNNYFAEFIPFISNPQRKCELELGASLVEVADGEKTAKVELTPNMWFTAILAADAKFADIDAQISRNAICIVTSVSPAANGEVLSAEAAQKSANTYYATVFEWSHRVDNLKEEFYLEENHWRAIDEIERFIASRAPFGISNKLINRIERFTAVYLAMGGEDDCLDRAVAAAVIPYVHKVDRALLAKDDRKLSEVTDDLLDMFGNKATRTALDEFGIA